MRSDKRPGWLLDELASAGRENLDADHVARYDDKEDAQADAEVATLTSLGLNEGSTLVDLGAGTGQLALAAAPRCRRVVAVDVSPVMLDVLRTKLRTWPFQNVDTSSPTPPGAAEEVREGNQGRLAKSCVAG